MKKEIVKCQPQLPKCWENRDLCNDNNKCTNDVCDPHVGCIHISKTCNDNNLCTKDVCDPQQGCVHTEIKCDDGVECTKDSCNPSNGQCEHVYEHTKCITDKKCTVGVCTGKGCQFKEDKSKCPTTVPDCKDCKTTNPCQIAECQVQADLTTKCIIKDKNCDDKIKCTKDSCDGETGKCVHTKIESKECTGPLCKDLIDCQAWAKDKELSKRCLVAECDAANTGVCVEKPVSNKNCVPVIECTKKCQPRDACEGVTESCTRDKEGQVICNRAAYPCDDQSKCTKDACNINTGVCSHVFVRDGKDCLEQCETDAFCIEWAKQSGLDKKCQTAVCNKPNKSCKIVDKVDKSECRTTECVGCVARNACEVDVKCVLDDENKPACVRVEKKCDDKNACTVDSCDTKTGKCVHTAIKSKVCTECKEDCEAWGKSLSLAKQCKRAVCDKKTRVCKAVDFKDKSKCTPPPECVECKPKNPCEQARCAFDKAGKAFCERTSISCDDRNRCTADTCDIKTGKCVHIETLCTICNFDSDCKDFADKNKLADQCREAYCSKTGKCKSRKSLDQSKCITKTPACVDCVPLNKCDSVKCVIENAVPKCVHSQTKCDDANKCTRDYCNVDTGECVHEKLDSDECKICKADQDCADYAKDRDLAASCQEAYCANNVCQIRDSTDKSRCLRIPLCYDCQATSCDEKVECVFAKDGKPVCLRTPKNCSDGNKCTRDSCDATTGDCVHTFFKTSQCEPCVKDVDCKEFAAEKNLANTCEIAACNEQGYCVAKKNPDQSKCPKRTECKVATDCDKWSADQKLSDVCQEADCVANACVSRPLKDLTKCPKCIKECVAKNPCEVATCIYGESGFICDRTQKNCDDKDDCTKDYCNGETFKCVNEVVPSEKCIICSTDKDCAAFSKIAQPNNCEEVFCDASAKLCKKRPIADKTCVPEDFCKLKCPPKDACYDSKCHYDKNNKVVCDEQVLKVCNDKDDCTDDSCDTKRGCVYTQSKKCTKCTKETDCVRYAIDNLLDANCKEAFCNEKGNCDSRAKKDVTCVTTDECKKTCETPNKCQAYGCIKDKNNKIQCNYAEKTCNDNKDCTKDSCDAKTGICVHETIPGCPICENTLNCVQWGVTQKLSESCQEPLCVNGKCTAVKSADVTKCPVKDCDKVCVSKTACETMKCAYDKNQKVICIPEKLPGCTSCTVESDCAALAKTAGKCTKVTCDTKQNKCVQEPVYSPECGVCPEKCEASSLCEVATLVKTKDSCVCKITPISCDDGNCCTVDVCDAKTGKCKNTFTPSDKCTVPCTNDVHCIKYSFDNKLSEKCQTAVCDTKCGTCVVKDDEKTNCKKCQLDCKPSSNCETAKCAWDGAKYYCERKSTSCDDGVKCTEDKCDPQSGKCVYVNKCDTPICKTDLDCAAWGVANQIDSKCLKPVCDTKSSTCIKQKKPECESCKQSSDCPPSKFGSICDTTSNTCKPNECYFDSDCLGKTTKPDNWAYCKSREYTGQKVCVEEPKCKENKDCDDKDPCTKDICLTEYGFCRNVKKCDDSNECTFDISTANADGTCTCSNVPVSCTTESSLLPKAYISLTNDEKSKWLGKCDKVKGCISCVVNSQCDDHNGCSTDSCENQVCVNKYVTYNGGEFNPWCDPKLASQPIYFQSIPGLRDQLALAGYDINKLAN